MYHKLLISKSNLRWLISKKVGDERRIQGRRACRKDSRAAMRREMLRNYKELKIWEKSFDPFHRLIGRRALGLGGLQVLMP